MPEITYDLEEPLDGIYALVGGLYVDEASPTSYIWHTQNGANMKKRRQSDRAVVQQINVSAFKTFVDLRPDGDVYHAVGNDLFRRDTNLSQVWKVTPSSSATVDGVSAVDSVGVVTAVNNTVYLYGEDSGTLQWSQNTPSGNSVADVTTDDDRDSYAVESIGETVRYDRFNGTVDWRASRPGDAVAAYRTDHVYVTQRNTDDIVQLDRANGSENWNRNNDFTSPSGLGVDGSGNAIIIHSNGVAKLSAADGSTVWNNTSVDYGDVETDVSVINNGDIIVFGNETLAALDQSTGAEQWSLTTAETSDTFSVVAHPRPGPYYSTSW